MLRLRGSTLLLYDQVILTSARGHILACIYVKAIYVHIDTCFIHLIYEMLQCVYTETVLGGVSP